MLKKKKNNKGFTLVELLVVIAIIGILAVVALPALFKQIDKSRAAKIESNYSAIKSAAAVYYTDHETVDGMTMSNLDMDKNGIDDEGNYEITTTGQDTATLTISGLKHNVESILHTKLEKSLVSSSESDSDGSITLKLITGQVTSPAGGQGAN